jgi:hypothetical protein
MAATTDHLYAFYFNDLLLFGSEEIANEIRDSASEQLPATWKLVRVGHHYPTELDSDSRSYTFFDFEGSAVSNNDLDGIAERLSSVFNRITSKYAISDFIISNDLDTVLAERDKHRSSSVNREHLYGAVVRYPIGIDYNRVLIKTLEEDVTAQIQHNVWLLDILPQGWKLVGTSTHTNNGYSWTLFDFEGPKLTKNVFNNHLHTFSTELERAFKGVLRDEYGFGTDEWQYYVSSDYAALLRMLHPALNVSNNPVNAITMENIENGNTLVNFHNESKQGRYYKNATFESLHRKENPYTRRAIRTENVKRYKASVKKSRRSGRRSSRRGGRSGHRRI